MIIFEDTRQQAGKHDLKHKWFEEHGIEVVRTALKCGDYTLPTDQRVCIDTKKDFQEIISNITDQHERLEAEAENAKKYGIHLIYLIENEGGEVKKGTNIYNPVITKLEDVHKWVNPRLFIRERGGKQKYPRATKGITLQKMLYTFAAHHGCEFMFCHPKDAGRIIVELLTNGTKNESETDINL